MGINKFKYNEIMKVYMDAHVSDGWSFESLSIAEYNVIKDCIKHPMNILDVGCGLGRMSTYINSFLDYKPKFTLMDSTSMIWSNHYGWNPTPEKQIFYNDLRLAGEFCKLNGLEDYELFDINKRNLNELNDLDMVMSFCSMGFHYPLSVYYDKLMKITTKDCLFTFGVNKDKYTAEEFEKDFEFTKLTPVGKGSDEEMLILQGKKNA
jgi:hypothetical protein